MIACAVVLAFGLLVRPPPPCGPRALHTRAHAVQCCEGAKQPRGQLGGRAPPPQRRAGVDEALQAVQRGRPMGARSTITTSDAGTLLITIPAAGLGGGMLIGGAFTAAWFSAVVPATFATGGAGALFLLPFWLAGGAVAKQTILDPAKSSALSIGDRGRLLSHGDSLSGRRFSAHIARGEAEPGRRTDS